MEELIKLKGIKNSSLFLIESNMLTYSLIINQLVKKKEDLMIILI